MLLKVVNRIKHRVLILPRRKCHNSAQKLTSILQAIDPSRIKSAQEQFAECDAIKEDGEFNQESRQQIDEEEECVIDLDNVSMREIVIRGTLDALSNPTKPDHPILYRLYARSKPKEFVRSGAPDKSGFDQNGILHWLGTNGGTQKWENPATTNPPLVHVSSSPMHENSAAPISAICGRENILCYTRHNPSAYCMLDFGDMRIKPSAYSIKDGGHSQIRLQAWSLQGKNPNDVSWTQLDKQSKSLTAFGVSNLNVTTSTFFQQFRLLSLSQSRLCCSGFELYGEAMGGLVNGSTVQVTRNKSKDAANIRTTLERLDNSKNNIILTVEFIPDWYTKSHNRYIAVIEASSTDDFVENSVIEPQILEFMDLEFSWADIADVDAFKNIAVKRVNATFDGEWNIIAVKSHPDNSGCVYGTAWKHCGLDVFIFRTK